MQAKDEELNKIKEKQLYAEEQLLEMEQKHQQVQMFGEGIPGGVRSIVGMRSPPGVFVSS